MSHHNATSKHTNETFTPAAIETIKRAMRSIFRTIRATDPDVPPSVAVDRIRAGFAVATPGAEEVIGSVDSVVYTCPECRGNGSWLADRYHISRECMGCGLIYPVEEG